MRNIIESAFALKKPCANCPFLKEGAIELCEGRLEGIIQDISEDDYSGFMCHKTVHSKVGGEWTEDEDGETTYHASGRESQCVGALVYLEKIGRPNVRMRLGQAFGAYNPDKMMAECSHLVIDPE